MTVSDMCPVLDWIGLNAMMKTECPNSSLQIFSLVCCLMCNENVDPFAYYVWSLGTTRKVSKRRIRIYCLLFIKDLQRVN